MSCATSPPDNGGVTVARMAEPDRDSVNRLGAAAYAQFEGTFSDWERFAAGAASLADHDRSGEVLVARDRTGAVLGAVGYFGPGTPRPDFFAESDALIRMLAVAPEARGLGIGKRLTQACIDRARRDGAACIALHTTPAMTVAQPRYVRMGFVERQDLGLRFGVPYAVYALSLA